MADRQNYAKILAFLHYVTKEFDCDEKVQVTFPTPVSFNIYDSYMNFFLKKDIERIMEVVG